ncbi:hypothetical protein RRG08_040499 [Elysia crispata]|uniref:Uncharacterized protein n=1 Tax=Elysia crispata TaxID=231223 RepID=A0AAE0Z4V3_9GAST|nr:hypothetical protein RRG08_040499 [Elysia crispata]
MKVEQGRSPRPRGMSMSLGLESRREIGRLKISILIRLELLDILYTDMNCEQSNKLLVITALCRNPLLKPGSWVTILILQSSKHWNYYFLVKHAAS